MKNKTRKTIKRALGVKFLNRVPFSWVFYGGLAYVGVRYMISKRGIFPETIDALTDTGGTEDRDEVATQTLSNSGSKSRKNLAQEVNRH